MTQIIALLSGADRKQFPDRIHQPSAAMSLSILRKVRAATCLPRRSWDVTAALPNRSLSGFDISTTAERQKMTRADYVRHRVVLRRNPGPAEDDTNSTTPTHVKFRLTNISSDDRS